MLVSEVAELMVDGEDGRGGSTATSTGAADPADVASTGIGCVSEIGPDAAIELLGEGSVATAVAGGEGVWINGAFVGSVETTMGLKSAVNLGDRCWHPLLSLFSPSSTNLALLPALALYLLWWKRLLTPV